MLVCGLGILRNCRQCSTWAAKLVAGFEFDRQNLDLIKLLISEGPTVEAQQLFPSKELEGHLHGTWSGHTLGAEGAQHVRQESQFTEILKLLCIDPADNSGPMTTFIEGAPAKSLLFMVTHDDGSSR